MSSNTIFWIVIVWTVLAIIGQIVLMAQKPESTGQDPKEVTNRFKHPVIMICLWTAVGVAVYFRYSNDGEPSKEAAGAPQAAPARAVALVWRIAGNVVGCQDYEIYQLRSKYAVQGDGLAFSDLSAKALAAGECAFLKEGEKVFLAENGILSKKVRREGRHEAYWIPTEAVKMVSEPNRSAAAQLIPSEPTPFGITPAPNNGPRQEACETLAKKVAAFTRFERAFGPRYMFKLPFEGRAGITVYCAADLSADFDSVETFADGREPPSAFHDLAARAGSVLGDTPENLQRLSRRCISRALKKRAGDFSTVENGRSLAVSCMANSTGYEVRFRPTGR